MALTEKIKVIADAIRAKTGGTAPLTLDQMPTEIAGIKTDPILETLTVTENGEYTPGEGVDGFDKVMVEVEGSGGVEMEFVHIEDWTTDEMGNAISFGDAYFKPYISSYPAAGIATIDTNTYSGDYAGVAIGLIYLSENERFGYARRNKNVNSGNAGLSFYIGAQSVVKVKVMQSGGVE